MVWAPLRNDVQTGPDPEPVEAVHASALESCQPSGISCKIWLSDRLLFPGFPRRTFCFRGRRRGRHAFRCPYICPSCERSFAMQSVGWLAAHRLVSATEHQPPRFRNAWPSPENDSPSSFRSSSRGFCIGGLLAAWLYPVVEFLHQLVFARFPFVSLGGTNEPLKSFGGGIWKEGIMAD